MRFGFLNTIAVGLFDLIVIGMTARGQLLSSVVTRKLTFLTWPYRRIPLVDLDNEGEDEGVQCAQPLWLGAIQPQSYVGFGFRCIWPNKGRCLHNLKNYEN